MLAHSSKIQALFDALVDIMIKAQKFKDTHPDACIENLVFNEAQESDQLRIELNRVLHMEGGQEVIEKIQETALNRIDAFEKARLQKF